MTSTQSNLIRDLKSRVIGLGAEPDIFDLPKNETDWSIFAHKLSSEPRIWIHTGEHNNISYALRIGRSSYQSPLLKQWYRGPNALAQVLKNANSPSKLILHSRPNEVDFYRQCMRCFTNHQILFFQPEGHTEAIMAQLHRILLPFFTRSHPNDGAPMFGQKAFTARIVAAAIMEEPRVLISDLLPQPEKFAAQKSQQPKNEPVQRHTPSVILFSAFILSLKRILVDETQWDDGELIGQIQGHDPQGSPLVLGSGSKKKLLTKWLSVVNAMPKNKPWHYESSHASPQENLYFPKHIRAAFGPRVAVIPSKEKETLCRINGLWFHRP